MKIRSFVQKTATTMLLALGVTTTLAQPGYAQNQGSMNYYCGRSDEIPTTMYQVDPHPETPLIRWRYTGFRQSGWTPIERCREVARRFDRFDREGALEFLTTGVVNNLGVVCAVRKEGDVCSDRYNSDRVLFTIPPGGDPNQALQEILNISGVYENNDPRSMFNGRMYINFDRLIIRNRQLYNN